MTPAALFTQADPLFPFIESLGSKSSDHSIIQIGITLPFGNLFLLFSHISMARDDLLILLVILVY